LLGGVDLGLHVLRTWARADQPHATDRTNRRENRPGSRGLKSVERQVNEARAYADSQGWPVVGVYIDDAVSGAVFEKRAELQRLLRDITVKPRRSSRKRGLVYYGLGVEELRPTEFVDDRIDLLAIDETGGA
jgi:Resolvase, N terminal domain